MRASALTGAAAAVTALAVVLSGCGSDSKTASSSSSSSSSSSKSSSTSATKTKPVEKPDTDSTNKNPTIATYIQENNIQESPVKDGTPGAPTVDLPVPDGWEPAGDKTPENAYGAIVYKGTDAGDPPPRIIAIFSKLTGDVDPQQILDLAPGELNNLPGFKETGGTTATLGEYPAYQLGGSYTDKDNVAQVIQQKTVVIPAEDGLFVLQLNAYAGDADSQILNAATDEIDQKTTITP
jgi:Probable lipoprotein LpqN